MKKRFIYRTLLVLMLMMSPLTMSPTYVMLNTNEVSLPKEEVEPLYDNVWGAIYHAEEAQCDSTPTITGDGSKINPFKASEHRWIAISQEMLDCEYRIELLNDSTSPLYKGRIEYGDTVWIDSPNENINGWWIVHDTKNKRYRKSIDFLQTKGDESLYSNDSLWSGRFDSIQIYSYHDAIELDLINKRS